LVPQALQLQTGLLVRNDGKKVEFAPHYLQKMTQ